MNAPRQTLSYLRDLFEARGLRAKSKLGQCFLIDLNLMDLIVRTGEVTSADLVLEVGTGTGSLTAMLAGQAGHVLGVEIDGGFAALTRETVDRLDNVTVFEGDVLKDKNHLDPDWVAQIRSLLGTGGVKRLKLIANLPYVVATPVISNLLLSGLPVHAMVVTIQWELAERLVAPPSTKDFGALSVLVQSLADVEIVRRMPPSAFWPRPKVDSAIVQIIPNAQKRAAIPDLPGFHEFLRGLYLHRRKNLRGTLWPKYNERMSREELDDVLRSGGFDPAGRAEALTVEQHHKLYQLLKDN